jgi:hypothetical protein
MTVEIMNNVNFILQSPTTFHSEQATEIQFTVDTISFNFINSNRSYMQTAENNGM